MLFKLIACNVFLREAYGCIAQSPHIIDAEFTEVGEHVHSATLRASLQARIDAADDNARNYDAILLLYGLCGNATAGLQARTKRVIIPRAHDCCAILLGSRERFREHFSDDPSTPFGSAGYLERGNYFMRVEGGDCTLLYGDAYASYVEQYGEEAARYIWDSLHPPAATSAPARAVFIDLPQTAHLGHAQTFRAQAEAEGKAYVHLDGDIRLIRALMWGEWNPEEFLIVEPGQRIAGVYDWNEIMRAEDGISSAEA